MLSTKGTAKCQSCWYWCSSSSDNSSPEPKYQSTVGCLWSWKELPISCCSWDYLSTWSWSMCCMWWLITFFEVESGTWKAYGEVTSAFCALFSTPSLQTIEECLGQPEQFVVLLYDHTSSQQCVNKARKQLFTQKGSAIDGFLPKQDVLIQLIKKATYQAGYCWAQMMIAAPELPSPSEWGWRRKAEGGSEECWTALPETTQARKELICCSCKN